MGTAGPIYLARDHLLSDDEPFFMFNSDVICDFPLSAMLSFHTQHGGEGTIMVTQVKDPSKYGVVVADASGQIERFVEKPVEWVGDKINAGIYLFNTAVVHRVQNRPTSIEREIFPVIAAEHKLYSQVLTGYWMDIGQPKDFLAGQVLHLQYTAKHNTTALTTGEHTLGNVIIHPTAKIGKGAKIGPDVVIGEGVVVGECARIKRSCLLEGVKVGPSAYINSSIIGWQSTIGSHAHVNESVLGEDVQIANEISVNEIIVCPHKGVGSNEYTAKLIM
jgi:mannose-1-phosphate guanylyltransferase